MSAHAHLRLRAKSHVHTTSIQVQLKPISAETVSMRTTTVILRSTLSQKNHSAQLRNSVYSKARHRCMQCANRVFHCKRRTQLTIETATTADMTILLRMHHSGTQTNATTLQFVPARRHRAHQTFGSEQLISEQLVRPFFLSAFLTLPHMLISTMTHCLSY